MDGTLVDSRIVVERTWQHWANKWNIDVTQIMAVSHGRRTKDVVKEFCNGDADHETETREIDDMEVSDMEGIVSVPGAAELLDTIPNTKWAVVTSAGRELAHNRLNAAGLPIPDILVSSEDVKNGKPNGEGYQLAAKLLGVDVKNCLVFEDALAGIQAGQNAGCDVIAVTHAAPHPAPDGCPSIKDFTEINLSLS